MTILKSEAEQTCDHHENKHKEIAVAMKRKCDTFKTRQRQPKNS